MLKSQVGDLHTIPISHGEGRFVAPKAALESLIANGQVATQYVDAAGQPTMDIAFNPNGSIAAIEGIFSPDGRVMGKDVYKRQTVSGPVRQPVPVSQSPGTPAVGGLYPPLSGPGPFVPDAPYYFRRHPELWRPPAEFLFLTRTRAVFSLRHSPSMV